jgi:glycine cleavage system H protein
MSGGLLSYLLCDRHYDCAHCPLDLALARGGPHASAPEPDRWTPPEFPSDRSYHPSHGWARAVRGARVRYGLDAFAAQLLTLVSAVVQPPEGSRLRLGQPACWLLAGGEPLPLRAPVSGVITRWNQRVRVHPELLTIAPYDEGYLLEVRCDAPLEEQRELIGADEARELAARQVEELREAIARPCTEAERVGPTLADGGEPLLALRRNLGEVEYRRLLRRLLS